MEPALLSVWLVHTSVISSDLYDGHSGVSVADRALFLVFVGNAAVGLQLSVLHALKFNICMQIMCVRCTVLSLCRSPTTAATVRQRQFTKDALFITNDTFTLGKNLQLGCQESSSAHFMETRSHRVDVRDADLLIRTGGSDSMKL